MTKQRRASNFSVLFLVLVIFLCLSWIWQMNSSAPQLDYAQVRQLFQQEKVEELTVSEGHVLTLKLKDSTDKVRYQLYSFELFYEDLDPLIQEQYAKGIIKHYDYPPKESTNWLEILLPWILMAGVVALLWYLMAARAQGGMGPDRMAKFGAARTRGLSDKDKKVTFDDVAGADEEKEELREIVEFLKDPKQFISLGARIPKGVLLVGPPGTGKTLLAKAVAGEAQVGFLSISGSDFVELYVGVGASRVRDLFEQAKKTAPCIVFIDEIDAVGRQRGTGLGGGHDEREQTLNQLLVEMDGFAANEGVVVLAATNRADVLDPALLRPGRFDRQIYVGLPDIRGREEILKVHAKGKPLAEDVDLKKLAQGTAGFTGADLENLINEGALLAGRKHQKFITMADLKEAEIKVIAGPEKRSRVIPQHERELTAWHEAGHAVVMHTLPDQDPVSQITIVPRGQAGGMTISLPEEDRSYLSKRYMEDQIVALLGGRVAEKLCLGDISTGASNDIQRATAIARKMVASYGMSDKMGTVAFEDRHDEVFIGRTMGQGRGYSEAVAAQIDEEVKAVVGMAYQRCEDILSSHRKQLDAVANYLLEHETMEREEFLRVFEESAQPEQEA
ncbi:ATP-dependent zinc metalloprotease FtsH [Oscillibacter valericigenes]|uniref:ATP-dependent zinc metalloprotease FtsH n=1 Tax=Oscillibacter valericigenes TaxID=351091 RepID=UPI001F330940|nr:ATP-dependent zinc metalloprotease FtsH [Oscillibacter valericigenes]MCF2665247.1 ATP-dependent zinc metalloprotease FtsH [Oscillibacter valericigenes]